MHKIKNRPKANQKKPRKNGLFVSAKDEERFMEKVKIHET